MLVRYTVFGMTTPDSSTMNTTITESWAWAASARAGYSGGRIWRIMPGIVNDVHTGTVVLTNGPVTLFPDAPLLVSDSTYVVNRKTAPLSTLPGIGSSSCSESARATAPRAVESSVLDREVAMRREF